MPATTPFRIDDLTVASPCSENWNAMTGDERRRHCERCALDVWNVESLTRAEVADLVGEAEGRLCMRLRRRADGTVITADCPVGLAAVRRRIRRLAAAAVAVLLASLAIGEWSKAAAAGRGGGDSRVVRWIRDLLGIRGGGGRGGTPAIAGAIRIGSQPPAVAPPTVDDAPGTNLAPGGELGEVVRRPNEETTNKSAKETR